MNTKPAYKLPTIKELASLVVSLKGDIQDDYRAYDGPDCEEDSTPSMLLTVGANEEGEWSYQTGDNSYSGGAYHYPHWAVVAIDRRSNSREIARDIQSQLAELMAY
jgi:hypothetical protein